MQFLLMAAPLHLSFKPFLTLGILADVGVVRVVLLKLHLILPGVLSQLVLLELRSVPVWSENALIVANLAVEAKALRVCSLDVSRHIRLLAESLVA